MYQPTDKSYVVLIAIQSISCINLQLTRTFTNDNRIAFNEVMLESIKKGTSIKVKDVFKLVVNRTYEGAQDVYSQYFNFSLLTQTKRSSLQANKTSVCVILFLSITSESASVILVVWCAPCLLSICACLERLCSHASCIQANHEQNCDVA